MGKPYPFTVEAVGDESRCVNLLSHLKHTDDAFWCRVVNGADYTQIGGTNSYVSGDYLVCVDDCIVNMTQFTSEDRWDHSDDKKPIMVEILEDVFLRITIGSP